MDRLVFVLLDPAAFLRLDEFSSGVVHGVVAGANGMGMRDGSIDGIYVDHDNRGEQMPFTVLSLQ